PVQDRHVLALDIAVVLQPLAKCAQIVRVSVGRRNGAEESDHRHYRLLRPRRERPCGRHTAEQRNELAPVAHSTTSSASASTRAGTFILSAFAAFRLMINSNLVGWRTGRSVGLAPLRIVPV